MMKPKKAHKKHTEKLPIEELLQASPWSAFIETLPAEVQRLSIQALDANDKGDYRRMKKTWNRSCGAALRMTPCVMTCFTSFSYM